MLNPFNEQDCCLNSYTSTDEDNNCHYNSDIWPTEYTIGWPTDPSGITSDIAYNSGILPENCLGLFGAYEPESVWSLGQFAYPAVTNTSNQANTPFFGAPPSQQPFPPDSLLDFCRPPPHRYLSASEATTLDGIEQTLIPHSVRARKPTAPSPSTHVSASRLQARSAPPRSRRAPYALGPDSPRRRVDLSTPVYQCQWADGAGTCSAVVAGTKSVIAQHLHTAHAIQLRADKTTTQRCLWEGCEKQMRGDCIPRHVLTVHIRDKVACPSCRLLFARVDSMQRHQKSVHHLIQTLGRWRSDVACDTQTQTL